MLERTCSVSGCERQAVRRGWCDPHYRRWQRHGDPTAGRTSPQRGRICSVEGCQEPYLANGLCGKHYRRWKQSGTTDLILPTPEERFWKKVNKHGPVPKHRPELGPCWVWEGATNGRYGKVGRDKKVESAHRVSWRMAHGPIPKGKRVLHHCDNPPCVKSIPDEHGPAHHFLGTEGDNKRDMIAKGRAAWQINPPKTHCHKGHEYGPGDYGANGKRRCRICWREYVREWRRRRKQPSP